MKNRHVFILAAFLLVVQQGCTGSMKGVVRQDAKRIALAYTDARVGKGVVQTTLPDGETFEGKLVRMGVDDPQAGAAAVGPAPADFQDVNEFEGNAQATLYGNRGNIMKCRFHVTDSILGLSGGGYGICQDTAGRVIDIFF